MNDKKSRSRFSMLKMSTLSQLKPDCDGNTKLICVACKLSKPFQTRGMSVHLNSSSCTRPLGEEVKKG